MVIMNNFWCNLALDSRHSGPFVSLDASDRCVLSRCHQLSCQTASPGHLAHPLSSACLLSSLVGAVSRCDGSWAETPHCRGAVISARS